MVGCRRDLAAWIRVEAAGKGSSPPPSTPAASHRSPTIPSLFSFTLMAFFLSFPPLFRRPVSYLTACKICLETNLPLPTSCSLGICQGQHSRCHGDSQPCQSHIQLWRAEVELGGGGSVSALRERRERAGLMCLCVLRSQAEREGC